MDVPGPALATEPSPAEPRHPAAVARPTAHRAPARLAIAAVVALAAGGVYYATRHGKEAAPAGGVEHGDEDMPAGAVPVDVVHPRRGGIERVTTQAGSVHAFEHASLYAKVSGYLKAQGVDIGDRVKRGQLLAEIDDPEVDKAVEQNVAALDHSRAKVKVAEAKVRSAGAARQASEALVKQMEAQVAAKVSNQDLQTKQLRRIAGLVASNAVEKKLEDEQQDRYDVAKADLGVARAEVISAQADVLSKAALVEEAEADLAESRADVEIAQANLARAKVMQDYTRITSPYDGVVTTRSFHRGDFIRSASEGGSVPVLAVARTDLMRVVLPVPDLDVSFVDRGDKAVVQIDALRGRKFPGEVARFAEKEDPESRNMRTEVDLANPDGKLQEGMYGKVTVILQEASKDGVTIPSSGLINQSGSGEGSVYVIKDGKAHKVAVHVGNDNGVEAEVLSGLTPADRVITSYNGPLTEGTPVKGEARKSAQAGH